MCFLCEALEQKEKEIKKTKMKPENEGDINKC